MVNRMSVVRKFVFGCFILQILISSYGKPLFLNHTFISSLLSASSSTSSQHGFDPNPYSENIAIVPPSEKQAYTTDFVFPTDTYDVTTTIAPPSLLQKKVAKILKKILNISQLKQAVDGKLQDNKGFQYPFTPDLDAKDIRINREYGQPLRIDLSKTKEKLRENESFNQEMEKVQPATLGIYLLEVFASVIGLTLGAAAQLNQSFSQSNNTV